MKKKASKKSKSSKTLAPIGIRLVSLSLSPTRANASGKEGNLTEVSDRFPTADKAVRTFRLGMIALFKYMEHITDIIDNTAAHNFREILNTIVEVANRQSPKPEKAITRIETELEFRNEETGVTLKKKISTDLDDPKLISHLRNYVTTDQAAERILHSSIVQQIACLFEQFCGNIMAGHYAKNIKAIPHEQQISFEELLDAQTIDDVRAAMVTHEVERLGNESTEKQIELVERYLGQKLRDHVPQLTECIEVLLRRHVLVHAAGEASRDYIRRLSILPESKKLIPLIGDDLSPSRKYVFQAWSKIFALGIVVGEMAIKKQVGSNSEQIERAEDMLNAVGFEVMKYGQFLSASIIFGYAHTTRKNTGSEGFAKLNLAICQKAINIPGWQKLVDRKLWDTSGPLFAIGAAAIREDMAEFCRLLPPLKAAEPDFEISNFVQWPVFQWLRKKEEYLPSITEVWGQTPSDKKDKERFHVLSKTTSKKSIIRLPMSKDDIIALNKAEITKMASLGANLQDVDKQ